ncbi:DUF924 family protein [Polaromonas sp. SM01]|uniref:DUF924 family protein n=1 Tax=Polaromonas sp. SM01 TaxID=3085630 RepID=UPI0029817CED|nr:DUF924 family protein [Polaromonas sp. SM01]MDW5443371.1 DUF924 family protein [Polaromonas sp. SM01]
MTSSFSSPPESVLDFWLGDGLALGWPSRDMGKYWFTGGPELDEQIRQLFGTQVALALDGGLVDWEAAPLHRLALVILLDQFPRNIFRGQAKAFAGDTRAQQLVNEALAQGLDEHLPWVGRMFLYMPLMHAEDLALQEECVRRFARLAAAVPAELRATITSSLRFAEQHRDIIARLGRFPYRNTALGRSSTAQEIEFLQNGPRFGQ